MDKEKKLREEKKTLAIDGLLYISVVSANQFPIIPLMMIKEEFPVDAANEKVKSGLFKDCATLGVVIKLFFVIKAAQTDEKSS